MSFDVGNLLSEIVDWISTIARRTGVLSELEHNTIDKLNAKIGLPPVCEADPAPVDGPTADSPQPITPAGGQGNTTQATFDPPTTPQAPTFSDQDGGGTND